LNKREEELCGDKVEIFKSKDKIIIVLADGLGSGVKANILATLTSKIAITMLKKGADIKEVIDTLIHTLPVCKVRNIAYSTFSIMQIDKDLNCKILESDNPPFFFLRDNKIIETKKEILDVYDKKVMISNIKLEKDDVIYLCSDGGVHAGVGDLLSFGWQWSHIAKYLEENTKDNATKLSQRLVNACNQLYRESPGDDTTVVTIKIRKPLQILLFTGPPIDKKLDEPFVELFVKSNGKKVVCGGTAAQIISRELDKPIYSSLDYKDKTIPPAGSIDGIDLVTEGVITLNRCVELIKQYKIDPNSVDLKNDDASTMLFKMLEESTHVKIWLGKAINMAHQEANFPKELSLKINIVNNLLKALCDLGKEAEIKYISEVDYARV
jgi:serine/threonine protein phosphatase PrpC